VGIGFSRAPSDFGNLRQILAVAQATMTGDDHAYTSLVPGCARCWAGEHSVPCRRTIG